MKLTLPLVNVGFLNTFTLSPAVGYLTFFQRFYLHMWMWLKISVMMWCSVTPCLLTCLFCSALLCLFQCLSLYSLALWVFSWCSGAVTDISLRWNIPLFCPEAPGSHTVRVFHSCTVLEVPLWISLTRIIYLYFNYRMSCWVHMFSLFFDNPLFWALDRKCVFTLHVYVKKKYPHFYPQTSILIFASKKWFSSSLQDS